MANEELMGDEESSPPAASPAAAAVGGGDEHGAAGRRAGYVAIVGPPNVGKSTLLNRILGEKISITSSKPQTTRRRLAGIYTRDDVQIVFVDTPGLLDPRYLLQEALREQAQKALAGVDLVYLVRDRADRGELEAERSILASAGAAPVFLVLNKVDTMRSDDRGSFLARAVGWGFTEIHPVSALTGEGVAELVDATLRRLPHAEFYFDPEELTDRSMRFLAAELVRETLFEQLEQELPYATHVEVTSYDESRPKPHIEATIFVERESQKAIVIGKGAETLKRIGIAAREKIEGLAGRAVFLHLHVKVRHNWRKREVELRRFGYRS